MFGEGDEAFGQPGVILDRTISDIAIPTYVWTDNVTAFNPFSGKSKVVTPEVAAAVSSIHSIQLLTGGVYDESTSKCSMLSKTLRTL